MVLNALKALMGGKAAALVADESPMHGEVRGHPWKMELGRPKRDYIVGQELRGRAALNLRPHASVLLMNRPLLETLQRRAYGEFTDTLQTTVDPNLPEELRWIAMYDEHLAIKSESFTNRYGVVSESAQAPAAWMSEGLARALMVWPKPQVTPQTPLLLMLLNGKVYLRMECGDADPAVIAHASLVLKAACEAALDARADLFVNGRGSAEEFDLTIT
jgi:hypothetical protein